MLRPCRPSGQYYELADTALLILRGRPTPFLHVYHHACTLARKAPGVRGYRTMHAAKHCCHALPRTATDCHGLRPVLSDWPSGLHP